MGVVAGTESVRLAELAASLSLATDIGLGVALEHAQRVGADDGRAGGRRRLRRG